jgi:hypothetical protein
MQQLLELATAQHRHMPVSACPHTLKIQQVNSANNVYQNALLAPGILILALLVTQLKIEL